MIAAGPVVVVAAVGSAAGSRAAAAALACAGSEPDRAALLIDLTGEGAARPTPVATVAARELEERLAGHLPDAGVASRGATCHLHPQPYGERMQVGPGEEDGREAWAARAVAAALPLVPESATVLRLPPGLVLPLAAESRLGVGGALLRADLPRDRALTALAAAELIALGLRVSVLKRPPARLAAALALLGAAPRGLGALPERVAGRLLGASSQAASHALAATSGGDPIQVAALAEGVEGAGVHQELSRRRR